jgi:Fe2+ transport system protein FeoA
MPLKLVQSGKEVILQDIDWGMRLRKKLEDMGLTPGVKFKVVSGKEFGPCIIEVRGTRLALGRNIVSKIQVNEIN